MQTIINNAFWVVRALLAVAVIAVLGNMVAHCKTSPCAHHGAVISYRITYSFPEENIQITYLPQGACDASGERPSE